MSEQDEYRAFLDADCSQDVPLVVEVPSRLPELQRRRRSGLNYSRYAVGVDAEGSSYEATGAVWQAWVVLGGAIAICAAAGIIALLAGEWLMVLVMTPLAGLLLAAMVRGLRAEQKAASAKRARLAKRRRAMRD